MTLSTQRKILTFAIGCTALLATATGCTAASTGESGSTPSPIAMVSPPTATSAAASPSPAAACPPDVSLLFERLKAGPVVDAIDSSLTGLEKPVCYQGWAVARTVVKNADSGLVLFKLDPATGTWNAVTFGTDGVCDGKVPDEIQAKLGAGC